MARKPIGRRVFLAQSALTIAGVAAGGSALAQMRGGGGMGGGGGGMGGGGGGGGGGTIVDPPVSGPLLALPVARGVPSTEMALSFTEYTIHARPASVAVGSVTALALVYDDRNSPFHERFVAPVIRASPGERVRLRFVNELPSSLATNMLGHQKYPTNVHVHGLHVSPGFDRMSCLPADDVHQVVAPGAGLVFDYDLSKQRPGSMALYHPHLHGTVAEQMWNGLVGAIDISDGDVGALSAFPTSLITLKDVSISNGAPSPYTMMSDYMHGKEGQLVTVNGQVNPRLDAQPGEVRRLRILNVSNARFYRLSLQGHSFHVVGVDGGLLGAPSAPQTEILLSPGERVDVLVRISTTKADYKLLALPYARQGNMASPQITLLTVRVGKSGRTSQAMPGVVNPQASPRLTDDSTLPRPRFALSMGMGRGYINGISFDVVDGKVRAFMHGSTVGTDEVWEVVNDSGMDHPWHQHVNDAQVLSISGGDAAVSRYAALHTSIAGWKDTIIIPKWGSATFRVPVRDFGGMTMFHCHILEHEDIGMMGMWHLDPMSAGGCEMPMPM